MHEASKGRFYRASEFCNCLIRVVLFFAVSNVWAKTGFYCGSFDPPTSKDVAHIRDAVDRADLDIILMVDRLDNPHTLSALERVEMLKIELQDLKDQVQIIAEPWSGKELFLQHFQDEICFIDLQEDHSSQELCPLVSQWIKERALYSSPSDPLEPLQLALHQEAFTSFVREASLHFPDENLLDLLPPLLDRCMSNLGRVDQFIGWVIQRKALKGQQAELFGEKSQKLLISSTRNQPYAKLHSLYPVSMGRLPKPEVELSSFQLPKPTAPENHTLDIETYCSDRFAKALSDHLISEKSVYFHIGTGEEAIAYHQLEGFTESYAIAAQAVKKLRNNYLLRNPTSGEVRFIVSDLHGQDTLRHVALQFNQIARFQTVHLVRHAKELALFQIPQEFRGIAFHPTDTFVIGFKNAIDRRLHQNPQWSKKAFSRSGLEIDIYENSKTKERLFASKCVYGDQLLEVLDFFYSRGMRQFQYFGTAGSLSTDIHTGDVVLPRGFVTHLGVFVAFNNCAIDILQGKSNSKIKLVELHGWIQSPAEETIDRLKEMQQAGVQSLDVESTYYAQFFKQHPDAVASLVLFVSDEPFGAITLDHFNTMDRFVDDGFNSVADLLLPT